MSELGQMIGAAVSTLALIAVCGGVIAGLRMERKGNDG